MTARRARPHLNIESDYLVLISNIRQNNWIKLRRALANKQEVGLKFVEDFSAWIGRNSNHKILEFVDSWSLEKFAANVYDVVDKNVEGYIIEPENRHEFFDTILARTGVDLLGCNGIPSQTPRSYEPNVQPKPSAVQNSDWQKFDNSPTQTPAQLNVEGEYSLTLRTNEVNGPANRNSGSKSYDNFYSIQLFSILRSLPKMPTPSKEGNPIDANGHKHNRSTIKRSVDNKQSSNGTNNKYSLLMKIQTMAFINTAAATVNSFPSDTMLDVLSFVQIKDFPPILLASSKIHGIALVKLRRQRKLLKSKQMELDTQIQANNRIWREIQDAFPPGMSLPLGNDGPSNWEDEFRRLIRIESRNLMLSFEFKRIEKLLGEVDSLIKFIQIIYRTS